MIGTNIAFIFLGVTLFVLLAGIVVMAVGGKNNEKYSAIMMTLRVVFQFLAVITLFLLYASHK